MVKWSGCFGMVSSPDRSTPPMGLILKMFEKILHLGIVQGFGEQR